MKHSSFDDMIRQKTVGYQAAVPEDAWENITRGKKKKRRIAFYWWYIMLLVPGTIGFAMYYCQHDGVKISSRQTGLPAATKIVPAQATAPETIQPHTSEEKPLYKSRSVTAEPVPAIRVQAAAKKQAPAASSPMVAGGPVVRDVLPTTHKKKLFTHRVTTLTDGSNMNPEQESFKTSFVHMDPSYRHIAPRIDIPVNGPALSLLAENDLAASPKETAKKKPSVKKNWSIDVSVTPFIPIQQNAGLLSLHRTQIGNGLKTDFTPSDIITTVEASMAYGITVRRTLSARWELGAGLQYARIWEKVQLTGTEVTTTYYTVKRLVAGGTGPQLVDEQLETVNKGTRTITARGSYNILSVPLFAQYQVIERRSFSLKLNAGAYVRVWQPYRSTIQGDFDATYRSGLQQGNYKSHAGVDLMAGLRLSAPLQKQFRLYTEPMFRYALLQNNSAGMINAKYLHQAGISFGVSYQISKPTR